MRDLRGVASVLEDVYQGAENAFQRIVRATGELTPAGQEWHTELLEQMSKEMRGVRPAVIRAETYEMLEVFRSFRHKVRHIYGFSLKWNKMLPLLESADQTITALVADLESFCNFLEQIEDEDN